MAGDLLIIFQVYLISWGLQLLSWPWLFRYCRVLVDRGWAAGRVSFSLTVALIVWFLANLKLPVNTDWGITTVILLLVFLTWRVNKGCVFPAFEFLAKKWRLLIVEEGLFLFGFAAYALARGFQPDISGLEKFPDFSFLKSYLVSPVLPAADSWWAGEVINYYSFGHFWASVLIRIWGVGADVGFNLMLAFLLASSLSLVFSVVINLLGMTRWRLSGIFSGLVGTALVVLGGNSHTIWSFLSKKTLVGYWYADATRFIYNTIHEFPAYSFVVSDLHPHLLDMPIVFLFLLQLIAWKKLFDEKKRSLVYEITLGLSIGVMIMLHTWDGMVYLLLLFFLGLLYLISDWRRLLSMVGTGVVVGTVAVVTALPWLIGFKPISDGVAAVTMRSPIWQLFVLWITHATVTLLAMSVALPRRNRNLLIIAIGLTALALLLIPEFIYAKDIYPNHPRANTMFKLTFQAFILMGILFGWLFGKLLEGGKTLGHSLLLLILFGAFIGLMIFPFFAFPAYFNNFKQYRGLSGFGFITERYPDDLAIIRYLEKNRNGRNMVEAVGESFTETSFVSAFSGTPTVVGWRIHDWLWRGGFEPVGEREGEVRKFYEEGRLAEAEEFVKKYRIGWILVGPRERTKYQRLEENKLKSLGEQISFGGSYLIKIR